MSRQQQYSEAFKREAVRKAKVSGNVQRTARELEVASKTLHQWIRAMGTPETFNPETATVSELNARIRELERQLAEKEVHMEVLKKAISLVSQPKPSGSR